MPDIMHCPLCDKHVWIWQGFSFINKFETYKTEIGEKSIVHWIALHNKCIKKGEKIS